MILLMLCLFLQVSIAQTIITTQTGNMDATQVQGVMGTSFAGHYNNGTELANYADQNSGSNNTPGAAAFRTFTTNQTAIGGTARTLRCGDRFIITAFAFTPATSGVIGISFKNNTTYSSVADYTNGQICRFELNDAGVWTIIHSGGTINTGFGSGADRTLQLDITSTNTFNATIAGVTYFNLSFINAGPVASFCIYNIVTTAAVNRSNPNSFWKNASLQGRQIDFGGNTGAIITGNINNGGNENSTLFGATNTVFNNTNILTLAPTISNSYTGTTSITAGTVRLGVANALPNTNITISNNATLSTGTTGFSQTLGTLSMTSNATIALGTGAHTLNFANSTAASWSGNLTITGWSPTAGQVFFGNTSTGLDATKLTQINFTGFGTGAKILSTGQIVPANYYISVASGNYNTGSTWLGGVVPPTGAFVHINNTHNVILDGNNSVSQLTINATGTFTASDASARSFTISNGISSTSLVNNGSWINGVGGSTIIFSSTGANVVHTITGNCIFNNVSILRTVGTPTIGVQFSPSTTINGNFTINAGGFVNVQPPFYGATSTLIYNSGDPYIASTEWLINATSGAGVPANVQIGNGAANSGLLLANSNYYCQGNFTISNSSGAYLAMNAGGGSIQLNGSWINNGTAANFTPNGGAISFNNTGNVTIGGTNTNIGGYTFNNLTINKTPGTVTLQRAIAINNNLTVTGIGSFSLNGFNLSVPNVLGISTGATINNNAATNCTLTITNGGGNSCGASIQNGAVGTLSIIKSGAGTQTLFGANTYSGTTTIIGGVLGIGSTTVGNGLSANSNYTLNGGNLTFNNMPAAASVNGGTLDIQTNSSITVSGTNAYNVNFAASSSVLWNAASTLTIINWTPSGGRTINVANATGLTSTQLSRVNFDNYGVGAKIVGIEVRPAFLYITQATGSGNYSNAASWLLGDRPVLNDGTEAIYVQGTFILTLDVAAPTVNLLRAEVGANATFTLTAGERINIFPTGDLRVGGTINMLGNSFIDLRTNTSLQLGGTFNMSATAILDFAAGISMTATTPTASFSSVGTLNCLGNFTINTPGSNAVLLPNINLQTGVDFGLNSTIQNGSTLTILPGGFIAGGNPPFYAAGSNLVYNTGGPYARGTEWIATSGRGYPANVRIASTTNFRLNNGSPAEVRQISGNLTIDAGRIFTMEDGVSGMSVPFTVLGNVTVNGELRLGNAIGGDIRVGGNYTIGATGSVFNNNRAVIFIGSTDQLITKTGGGLVFFDFFVVDKPLGVVKLTANTNGYIIAPVNNVSNLRVMQLIRGDVDMNDGIFTVQGDGINSIIVLVDNGPTPRRIYTSTGVGEFRIRGTSSTGVPKFTVVAQNGGKLVFDNNVEVSTTVGVDFGPSNIATINAVFRIDQNGYVINNSPNYGIASTLVYNNGVGGFKRNLEWNTDVPGANRTGYPNAVIVQNNTPLQLNSTDFPATFALGCSGKMNIEAGSSVITDAMAYPLSIGDSLNIRGTLTLSTNNAGNLNVGGSWTRTGTFVQNNRMVTFNGANLGSINVVGGETFSRMTVDKTNNANILNIDNPVTITNELFLQRGTLTLNNEIIIQSNATQTARIGQTITPANISVVYNGIGKFVIQRYLPITTSSVGRRWRLITAPLKANNAPTINTAWQEGQVSVNRLAPVNLTPGFGTAITRTTTASNGFDQGITNNSSLLVHNGTAWIPATATNTGAITDQSGYMLFVRGDRSIIINSFTDAAVPTTLRPKGEINIGTVSIPMAASGVQVIGNPYASAISFNTVTINGVNPGVTAGSTFYLWDPKHVSGTNVVGGFVTCTSLGSGLYSVTANSSGYVTGVYNGTIESSMAIMVPANGGSFVFNENCKLATNSTQGIASRPDNNSPLRRMDFFTTNLYRVFDSVNQRLMDGVNVVGSNNFENEVNSKDAPKYTGLNATDNLAILRSNKKLAIELRKKLQKNDTIFYEMGPLAAGNYQFSFKGKNINPSLKAIFIDNFNGAKKLFSPNDSTLISFSITNDSSSKSAKRFMVVFKSAIKFANFTSIQKNNNIELNWQTLHQLNIKEIVIERSVNGVNNFEAINTIKMVNDNLSQQTYVYQDNNLPFGTYTYRLKGVSVDGEINYSDVLIHKLSKNETGISVFPNPIKNNTILLQTNSLQAGLYNVSLIDLTGKIVFANTINHNTTNSQVSIKLLQNLPKGIYQLKIISTQKSLAHYTLPIYLD